MFSVEGFVSLAVCELVSRDDSKIWRCYINVNLRVYMRPIFQQCASQNNRL